MAFLDGSKKGANLATLSLLGFVGTALSAAGACSTSSPGATGNSTASSGSSGGASSSGNGGSSSGGTSGSSGASGGGSSSGSSSGSSKGGSSSGSGTSSSSSSGGSDAGGCVPVTGPVLLNFEGYNPTSDGGGFNGSFGTWPQLGYIGPYAYSGGGPDGGTNWTLKPVTGQTGGTIDGGQDWALDLTLTQESGYGGALGFWMSCANASAYKGISFWARGQTPMGTCSADAGSGSCFSMSISTSATSLVADGGVGTCTGTSTTCVGPQATNLPLSMTWTQFQIPWAQFGGGMAGGVPYTPTGDGIIGLTFNLGLLWMPVEGGYAPIPATLDFQVDDISFMP